MADALRIEGLCKRYGTFSLKDVGFRMESGTIMGLVGENGAGKTTTIKAILGLVRPDGGRIEILGREASFGAYQARAQVCLLYTSRCV